MKTTNPFAPDFEALPEILPIFPLSGVLLLPCGELPLNIFEPRYRAMVEDSLAAGHRMIGMIQPCACGRGEEGEKPSAANIYKTGCAGKIIDFSEAEDGRYLITLSGIRRFRVSEELSLQPGGYRAVRADWSGFEDDVHQRQCLQLDRETFKSKLRSYFDKHSMECDWDAVDDASDGRLITCLSMICPFQPSEKQALLEAQNCKERAELFMQMLSMEAIYQGECGKQGH